MTAYTCSKSGKKFGLISNLCNHYDEKHEKTVSRTGQESMVQT
ncbi:MAG: hypothetical protein ABEJ72_01060 [Candidatus Aenigmatarchaeota archaeon]